MNMDACHSKTPDPFSACGIVLGDWVETDRGEIGLITELSAGPVVAIAEVCVGRCYRQVPLDRIKRKLEAVY